MGVFDYRGQDARDLVNETIRLAVNFHSPELFTVPDGWRALTAAELGIAQSKVDAGGYFKGDLTFGAQAQVWAKFDTSGNVEKLTINYLGTNDTGDLLDYQRVYADKTYAHAFDYMLDAARGYATNAGLTGTDVTITGASLGGGAVNNMAIDRQTAWGGFYAESNFISLATPIVTEDPNVLNIGFENDVVFRSMGEGQPLWPTALLGRNDSPYGTTTDNMVLFDDTYANPNFPTLPFIGLSLVEAWAAHVPEDNPFTAIANSTFYDYTARDSVIVVSSMSSEKRLTTWLEDKNTVTSNHYGELAFLIGSDQMDKIRDGASDDFVDGFAGDDLIRISTGNDHVAGGLGQDTVIVSGNLLGREAYRMADGTVYLFDENGTGGLDELTSVERLQTDALIPTTLSVDANGIYVAGTSVRAIAYSARSEGTAGGDQMRGGNGNNNFFGRGGDDTLSGGNGSDLLVGGLGNDTLRGGYGHDTLFGDAGDDVLSGSFGNDRLSGGVGSDVFDFVAGVSGNDLITDFNSGAQGHDIISFSRNEFSNFQDVWEHSRQSGTSVLIQGYSGTLELSRVTLAELSANDFLFV